MAGPLSLMPWRLGVEAAVLKTHPVLGNLRRVVVRVRYGRARTAPWRDFSASTRSAVPDEVLIAQAIQSLNPALRDHIIGVRII